MSQPTLGGGLQTTLPRRHGHRERRTDGVQSGDPLVELPELARGQITDLPTGRMTRGALAKDARELIEREADAQRAPDDANAVDGGSRVAPVATSIANDTLDDTLALVMPNRIDAHACLLCNVADEKSRAHGDQRKAWNRFQSQGLAPMFTGCSPGLRGRARRRAL